MLQLMVVYYGLIICWESVCRGDTDLLPLLLDL